MFVPFFFHHNNSEAVYGAVNRAFLKQHWWTEEPIKRYEEGRSYFVRPGELKTNAVMVNLPVAKIVDFNNSVYYEPVEYSYHQFQEFKYVPFTYKYTHYFNRKSGRYLYTDKELTYDNGKTFKELYAHNDGTKDINGTELLEEQRP